MYEHEQIEARKQTAQNSLRNASLDLSIRGKPWLLDSSSFSRTLVFSFAIFSAVNNLNDFTLM
jgi:hypothetical protein